MPTPGPLELVIILVIFLLGGFSGRFVTSLLLQCEVMPEA